MIAERPKTGAYAGYAGTIGNVLNAYVSVGDHVAVYNLASNAGNWDAHQFTTGAIGLPRAAIMSLANDGNWSYPDDPGGGSWGQITTHWFYQKWHNNLNPAHRAVWTAPADYDKIAILLGTYATFDDDISVALSGSGSLEHASINTAAGSPFAGYTPVDQKWLLLAENMQAGDTLTFTPTNSATVRLAGIMAWNESAVAALTASNENIVVHEGLAQDAYEANTPLLGALANAMTLGNTLAINVQDDLNGAAHWGSPAHASATHRLEATNDTVRYKPYGGAEQDWTPAIGNRVESEYLKVTTAGNVRMFDSVVGTYTQTIRVADDGVHITWQITWNAQAAVNGVKIGGGHHTMFRISNAPTRMVSVGGLRQILALDDDSLTALQPCDIVRYQAGDLGGYEILCRDVPTARTSGAKTQLQQRADTSQKHYANLVQYDVSEGGSLLAAVNSETFSSEAHYLIRAAEPVDFGALEIGKSLSMASL